MESQGSGVARAVERECKGRREKDTNGCTRKLGVSEMSELIPLYGETVVFSVENLEDRRYVLPVKAAHLTASNLNLPSPPPSAFISLRHG